MTDKIKRFLDCCTVQAYATFALANNPCDPYRIQAYVDAEENKNQAAKEMNDEYFGSSSRTS